MQQTGAPLPGTREKSCPGCSIQSRVGISQVSADGAYDNPGCHVAIAERDAGATISPRDGAVSSGNHCPGDTILQEIETRRLAEQFREFAFAFYWHRICGRRR